MLKSIDKIISILQANPAAYISYGWLSAKVELVNGDECKSVNFDTFLKIRPTLVKLPYDGRQRDRYYLRQ